MVLVNTTHPHSGPAVARRTDLPPTVDLVEGNRLLGVAGVYETWVGLDGLRPRPEPDWQVLIQTRERAADLRSKAKHSVEHVDAIRQQAQRIRDAARRAAIQIRAVAPRDAVLRISAGRERDQTNSAQTAFQQSALSEVWDEAERASFDALNALGTAKGQVQREIKEAEHLASMAESVVELAQKELEGARQVVEELLLGGQQTSDGAGVARISDAILPGDRSEPQSVRHSTDGRPEDSVDIVQGEVSETGIQEGSEDPHSEEDSPLALGEGEGLTDEIVGGTAIQETPPEPADQAEASATGGRDVGQSLFQKSSAIIGAIASPTRSHGARELRKGLFGKAAPDQSASQPPAQEERSPKTVQRRGMPIAEAWAKRRVDPSAQEVEEVTEEALKRDLAELRQSLVDIRKSADKA